jgi:cytochrome c-type biogenesis protein CcmH/NrfF
MTGISRKTMIPKLIQLFFLALLPSLVLAETAEQQQARVGRLERAVLAPCCYTEPVAIHQSEIAIKMRLEIAKWVEQGRTDQEVLDTYARLYGAKVLVDPNVAPGGWSYLVPWAVVVLGAMSTAWILWRRQMARTAGVVASTGPDGVLPEVPDFDDK